MKKMFGRFLAAGLALLMTVALAACSGGGEAKTVKIEDLAKQLVDGLTWKEELMEVTSESVMQNYYQVDMADVKYWALYRSSSGATAEEIAVFEGTDAEAAGRIKDAVSTRVEDLKFAFEDYVPAEMPKIENAVVYTSGNYVVLVTNDDDAAALDMVKKFFA